MKISHERSLKRMPARLRSMQSFQPPSVRLQIPFEPGRTVNLSDGEWHHLIDPGQPRGSYYFFDRMMKWFQRVVPCLYNLRVFHSDRKTSLLGLPILSPDHAIVHAWTAIITLVDLTYTAFLVPISIAFDQIRKGSHLSWLTITDIVGSGFYVADMTFEFHIGFVAAYDIRRKLILRRGQVAENYIRRGGFIVDFLSILAIIPEIVASIIPAADGAAYKVMFFFRLLRLLRVVRLLRGASGISFLTSPVSGPVLNYMNTATFYLLNILFTLIVLINLLGCIWWFVAVIEGLNDSWVAQAGVDFNLADANSPAQYVTSVYFAMTVLTTVGFGDITPQTVAEMLIAILFMIVAVFYFGYIVNAVAQLSTMLSSKARGAADVREKMEEVDMWTSSRHIPDWLRQKVRRYYMEVWATHSGARLDDASHFLELPVELRAELVISLAGNALSKSHMLSTLPDELLNHLAMFGLPKPLTAGHDLYQEGQAADDFWVLQEGELRVLRGIREVGVIKAPAVVGQSAIFKDLVPDCATRIHTMRAWINCTLWEFPGITFANILRYHPGVFHRMVVAFRDHLQHLDEKWSQKSPPRIKRMISDLTHVSDQLSEGWSEIQSSDASKSYQMFSNDEMGRHDEKILFYSEHFDHQPSGVPSTPVDDLRIHIDEDNEDYRNYSYSERGGSTAMHTNGKGEDDSTAHTGADDPIGDNDKSTMTV